MLMGVLTDFFIGDDNTARNVDQSLPPGHADRVCMKGIMQAEISQLQCILTGREWSADILDEYQQVYRESDEGPWVCRVPVALVSKLAQLEGSAVDDAARKSLSIEDFQDWPIDEMKAFLIELVSLAKRAQS